MPDRLEKTGIPSRLQTRYAAALRKHLAQPSERTLLRASDLGLQAARSEADLVEMVFLHHETLARIMGTRPPRDRIKAMKRAGEFLAESLAPFGKRRRSRGEVIAALRHMNDRLEGDVKQVAHALHNEAGGILALTHLAVADLARDLASEEASRLAQLRELLDQMDQQLRRLSHDLRPTILDDLGLLPALEFLAKVTSNRTKLQILVEKTAVGRLPPAVETTLYRGAQEGLENAVRHARAEKILIQVVREPRAVLCVIRDDGAGFDVATVLAGHRRRALGLIGLRDRLEALSGSLQITSAPGQGTELLMNVPLGG
jgi:signal transduction histidine kinase